MHGVDLNELAYDFSTEVRGEVARVLYDVGQAFFAVEIYVDVGKSFWNCTLDA